MDVMKRTALKRLLAAGLLGVCAPFAAHADDPASGATLFSSNCTGSGCHNTATPLTSNATKIYTARNARAWIQSNINSDNSGMGRLSGLTAQQVANIAAYLGNFAGTATTATTLSGLTFPSTAIGTTSATTQTVTIAASTKSGYALSALSVATSGDFARSGGTCGTTLATGTTCTVIVSFTPTAAGTRSGTLTLSHASLLTPIATALTGTGSGGASPAPVATITPTSLTLASTAIGTTSAAQNVTVSNTGSAALSISALTLSNTADFVIAGGTCSAGGSVAAASSCTVSLTFRPAAGAAGARTGSLSIVHNAPGSPGSVNLSGTATAAAAPAAALTASLAYGSLNVGTTSTAQTATLSNTGNAPLTIGTLSTGSTEFAISGGTCAAGGTVAAAGSCTVNLTFTPSAAGARTAMLTITHTAAGGQSSTSLSGTGVALTPVIGLSPTTLSFSQMVNTTSVAQTVTLSNTGNAPLVLGTLTLGGALAAEFLIASGTTCTAGGSVAANASCAIKLSFTPTANGPRSASLAITHNAAGSPSSVTLNGTGTATAQPAMSLNAATLTFGSQVLGSASASQSVVVTNSGSATLTFSGLTLAGSAATDFTRGGTCSAIGTLTAGATCTVSFTFTPGAIGARSATLTLASDASNGSAVLSLTGTGAPVPTPSVSLAPSTLAFGSQSTGVPSTVRSATLTNSGSGALNLTGITATSGFGVSHNCGSSVATGASCTLSVTFTPTGLGAAAGSVSVASNATGSPHAVSLSGTGVVASPVLVWVPTTTAVAFGDASVGASPYTQSLTLSNQGPGSVTLQQITLAGAQAADFSLGGGTCVVNAPLAQGASCTLVLAFQPGAAGARNATLHAASSGTNPPDLALAGNGTSLALPAVSVVPGTLSFVVGTGSTAVDPQTLTLQNTGNAVLRVNGMRIASGSFTLAAAATNGCAPVPFDLMPAQSCLMAVGWSNSAPGIETGIVEIDTTAAARPMQVALQAVRDATPVVAPGMSNAGAGGCSIARGDSLADPTLWLLILLAVGVLWHRRAERWTSRPRRHS
jgi:trimeric autotransporter adhesin